MENFFFRLRTGIDRAVRVFVVIDTELFRVSHGLYHAMNRQAIFIGF
jgi:hypothetical protein